jgi:hypothetical protein
MANWINKAVGTKPGALHRALHIPLDQKIPAARLAEAAKMPGKVGKEARLAQTLKGLRKK